MSGATGTDASDWFGGEVDRKAEWPLCVFKSQTEGNLEWQLTNRPWRFHASDWLLQSRQSAAARNDARDQTVATWSCMSFAMKSDDTQPASGISNQPLAFTLKRYRISLRIYPQTLPPIEYPSEDTMAVVKWNGEINFKCFKLKVSNALLKLPVAFRADSQHDGCYDVFFCHHRFMRVDLNALRTVS